MMSEDYYEQEDPFLSRRQNIRIEALKAAAKFAGSGKYTARDSISVAKDYETFILGLESEGEVCLDSTRNLICETMVPLVEDSGKTRYIAVRILLDTDSIRLEEGRFENFLIDGQVVAIDRSR